MEMNEIRRAIVRSAVQKGIREIREDPERGVRKLVDLGSHFSKGRFQKQIFCVMQQEMHRPDSAYYGLVTRLAMNVRPECIERFGIDIGYNSWTHGATLIRAHEAQQGYNVPWCLVLDLRQGLEFDLDDLMRQGEALGIYAYIVFAGAPDCTAAMLPVMHRHRDCAVFLMLPGARMPVVNWECLDNVMTLLPLEDEGAADAARELSARGCLYGLWAHYGAQCSAVIDGEAERRALSMGALGVMAVPEPDADAAARAAVRDYVCRSREHKTHPTFLADLFSDIEAIDRVISVEPCMMGISSDGVIFTAKGRNPYLSIRNSALDDVLMCAMPRVTYIQTKE